MKALMCIVHRIFSFLRSEFCARGGSGALFRHGLLAVGAGRSPPSCDSVCWQDSPVLISPSGPVGFSLSHVRFCAFPQKY